MDRQKFLLADKILQIESSFIKDGWVTIYENTHTDNNDQGLVYCCTVSPKRIKSYMLNSDWVIQNGYEGKPTVLGNGKYETNGEKGIEPFLFSKHFTFNSGHESYIDISEEFILYFKLYEKGINKQNRIFYFIDECGDLDEVIIVEPNRIRVKLKYLKEYISIRKIYFSICFDFMRLANNNLEELDIIQIDKNFHADNYFYNHFIRNIDYIKAGENQSWIHGKVFIQFDKNKTKSYHFDHENREYAQYITGFDKDGNEILNDCQKEDGKHFILTYFKKEVLNKYYNDPTRYKIDGWSISSNFFSLKIDNNVEDYVPVFLIELGTLPYKEQLHWKQYNISPKKGISETYYKTMIEGNWAEHPESPDLFFKHKYEQFNSSWEKEFGWKLYKSLAKKDQYIFTSLHIPTSNNVKSFCEQILSIVKITIDRLNEKEFANNPLATEGDKGIAKLEKFLRSKEIEIPDMIIFLKKLWDLRSGLLSHSFSEKNVACQKAIQYFGLREDNYKEVATDIFINRLVK